MFKEFLRCTLASILSFEALSAEAADLPLSNRAWVAPEAPIFTWSGFHVGYNHGYGGAIFDSNAVLTAPAMGGSAIRASDQASGWFVGGQIGYDYQFANGLVLGLETDLQWSDLKSSHQGATAASNPLFTSYANASQTLDWFGTTRARVGYSVGRLLPYLTGGVAYGGASANSAQLLPGGGAVVGNAHSTNAGWAAGAGLDIALTDQLSARAEYLYLRLPGVSGPAVGLTPHPQQGLAGGFSTGATEAYAVRTGMNYRFGGLNDLQPKMEGGVLAFLFKKPEVDWSGLHMGVNGGYGGGVVNSVSAGAQPGLAFNTYATDRFGGALAGGQVGYDYQFANQLVAGIETDLQWSGIQSAHQGASAGRLMPNGFVYNDSTNAMTWFGTTRARLGYARASTLLYLTAGVAYGGLTATSEQFTGALFSSSSNKSQIGWTVGSGAEYPLTDKMSLKAEYLYTSFGGINGAASGIAPAPFPGILATGAFATQVTRVGLNWRFGGMTPSSVVPKF